MARGIAFAPGSSKSRFSLLYVDDLSSAISAWLKVESRVKETFEIDDGHVAGYDWHEISRVVGDVCNRRVRVFEAKPWMLDLPAWLNSRVGAVFGTSPMLTPEKLRELRHPDWVCDNSAFQEATEWQPGMTLVDGLRATPNWAGYRGGAAGP
jgi:nucleoside-diphosphate-sugar epimerase